MAGNKTLTDHMEAADFEQVKPLRKGTVYVSSVHAKYFCKTYPRK